MHVDEELLFPKDEPQDVEKPHAKDHGVAENTHAEPSTRNGRRCQCRKMLGFIIFELTLIVL